MKENSICGDNRFEIIEKAKEMLLNATNIEDSKEEMKVLTNILFRMWQVGLINEEKLEINKLQKENSIEEDIKDIEKYISFTSKRENFSHDTDWNWNKDLANKIEHILSDYKRVLKENEELLEVKVSTSAHNRILELEKENEELKKFHIQDNKHLDFIMQHSIPVQKVKDKTEELEEELEIMKVDNMYGRYKEYGGKTKWERLFATKYGMHDALQELLEGRK